jgi:tRNA (cytidine/uridine-2'-O-)-methyltransferase
MPSALNFKTDGLLFPSFAMNIVLINPEIPPNTGNIARLCAVTRTTLHLIEPLGFKLDDRDLKRAGMDYWQHLEWHRWPDWATFERSLPTPINAENATPPRFWMVECAGNKRYDQVQWQPNDYIVLGRETKGIPEPLLDRYRDSWIRIPMFNTTSRSLNLSNCAALVLYEALRQTGFRGEISPASQP